jgi:hypothetical protein
MSTGSRKPPTLPRDPELGVVDVERPVDVEDFGIRAIGVKRRSNRAKA